MAAKSDILVSLGLDFANMQKGLATVEKAVKSSMATIRNVVIATAAAIGVGLTIKGVAGGIGSAIAYGKELDSLSRQTQVTVKEIVIMQHALDRTGLSAEETADVMATLRNNLIQGATGFGETGNALNRLGIDFAKLKTMGIPEQFAYIAGEVNKITNPLVRTTIATQIFGAAGAKAVANFQSGDLAQAIRLFGANAERMQKAAATMAFIQDAWNRIKGAGTEFFNALTTKIAPLIKPVLDHLEEIIPQVIDAGAKFGEYIANAVKVLVEAFKEGKLMELIGVTLSAAFRTAGDTLIGVIQGAMDFAGNLLKQLFGGSTLGEALKYGFLYALAAFEAKFLSVFRFAIALFGAGIETAIDKFVALLPKSAQQALGFDPARTAIDFGQRLKENIDAAGTLGPEGNTINDAISAANDLADEFGKKASDAFNIKDLKAAVDAFKEGFSKGVGQNIFDSKEAQDKAGALIKGLLKNFVLPEGKPIAPRPGTGPDAKTLRPGLNMNFDELRRIGGGIGGTVQNIQQSQLDALKQIANNTKAWLDRQNKPGFSKGYQQVGASFGLPGTGLAGAQ